MLRTVAKTGDLPALAFRRSARTCLARSIFSCHFPSEKLAGFRSAPLFNFIRPRFNREWPLSAGSYTERLFASTLLTGYLDRSERCPASSSSPVEIVVDRPVQVDQLLPDAVDLCIQLAIPPVMSAAIVLHGQWMLRVLAPCAVHGIVPAVEGFLTHSLKLFQLVSELRNRLLLRHQARM